MSTTLPDAQDAAIEEELAPPADIRRLAPLWGWLRGLLIAYIVVNAIFLGALLVNIGVWNAVDSPEAVEFDLYTVAIFSDAFLGVAGIAYFIVYVWCGFLFLRFTHRAMRNLWQLDARDATVPPFWAVAWYFVPIAAFWKPLQAVRQIWRNTENFDQPRLSRVPASIGWWWTIWIVNSIIGGVSFRLGLGSGFYTTDAYVDPSIVQIMNVLDTITTTLEIPLALLALSFMSRIARMQDERFYMARQF